jgi:hypothetical protein
MILTSLTREESESSAWKSGNEAERLVFTTFLQFGNPRVRKILRAGKQLQHKGTKVQRVKDFRESL